MPPAAQRQRDLCAARSLVSVDFVEQRQKRLPSGRISDAENVPHPLIRHPLVQNLGRCKEDVRRFPLKRRTREHDCSRGHMTRAGVFGAMKILTRRLDILVSPQEFGLACGATKPWTDEIASSSLPSLRGQFVATRASGRRAK
jgi:hypothetical protein